MKHQAHLKHSYFLNNQKAAETILKSDLCLCAINTVMTLSAIAAGMVHRYSFTGMVINKGFGISESRSLAVMAGEMLSL